MEAKCLQSEKIRSVTANIRVRRRVPLSSKFVPLFHNNAASRRRYKQISEYKTIEKARKSHTALGIGELSKPIKNMNDLLNYNSIYSAPFDACNTPYIDENFLAMISTNTLEYVPK